MVSKSFILLMIGVSILEVTSWPRRGFGGFGGFLLSDNPDEGQNGNKNEKVEENKPEGGQGRFHNRNGEQGFGIPFANPAAIIPRIQAIRENFQKLPSLPAKVLLGKNGILQNFFSSGDTGASTNSDASTSASTSTSTSTSTSSSTSTSTSPTTSTSTSTSAITSTSTSTSTIKPKEEHETTENVEESSSEQPLKDLPAEFTFMLPTEMSKKSEDAKNESPSKNSNNLPQKTDDQKDSAANGTRRLINAPLRCQEDSAGNCREAF